MNTREIVNSQREALTSRGTRSADEIEESNNTIVDNACAAVGLALIVSVIGFYIFWYFTGVGDWYAKMGIVFVAVLCFANISLLPILLIILATLFLGPIGLGIAIIILLAVAHAKRR